ncbi:hypothetical protein Q5H93_23960 [Hymenobacter sp. ASUV-10]|uniref:Uncharacterized protein n=1 Tax=Hymenobacter aranciens TaxID=3063996 RepID=A0ABT9BMR6_9BACT|nr:hypothetical protein [Hymenobacter sp. ASUV-10]MDO7877813.1 hypothetical protein [Hymenobacter sp. ASUV-10]
MKQRYFLLAGALALAAAAAPAAAQAQTPGVGIGTTAPDASAALDIVSSDKGALLPRLTEDARLAMGTGAVPAPAVGLLVYQTDGASPGFYYAASPTAWTRLTDGASADGRYIQNQTAADQPASFRLSGDAAVGGRVGIGTTAPGTRLSISPTLTEPKITLYDGGGSEFYGFGVSSRQLNYHIDQRISSHVFSVEGRNGDGIELLRIQGNGRVGIGTPTPGAVLDVQGGADSNGTTNPGGLALSWRGGGYRHFLRSRHNSVLTAGGNALDFFLNNGSDAEDSRLPSGIAGAGTGNVHVLTLENNNGQPVAGIGTMRPLTRLSITPSFFEPKITLYDGGSATNYYGLGVSSEQLNYHVSNSTSSHVFSVGGKNGDGTELLRIQGNGRVGVGTAAPAGQLANTSDNTVSSDGYGGNAGSLNWATSQYGYAAQLYNGDTGGASNGLLVKINGTNPDATLLDLSKGPQTSPGTRLLLVRASGAVTVGSLAGTGTRLVTADANGTLTTAALPTSESTTASNGLTRTGTDVRLGGPLAQDTNLGTNGYSLTLTGGGRLGLNTSAPTSLLANTDTNIIGSDGQGVSFRSLGWSSPDGGYAAAVYNTALGASCNGLAVKVAGTDRFASVLDVSSGAAQNAVGTSLLNVRANGYVGIGTNAPGTSLDVDGALALRPANAAIAITADDQAVPVGNRSYLRLASNSTTGTSRTIVLGAGAQPGQLLYLEGANTLNNAQCELLDTGNANLPANRTITYADVLTLLWNGTQWLEVSYTNN